MAKASVDTVTTQELHAEQERKPYAAPVVQLEAMDSAVRGSALSGNDVDGPGRDV